MAATIATSGRAVGRLRSISRRRDHGSAGLRELGAEPYRLLRARRRQRDASPLVGRRFVARLGESRWGDHGRTRTASAGGRTGSTVSPGRNRQRDVPPLVQRLRVGRLGEPWRRDPRRAGLRELGAGPDRLLRQGHRSTRCSTAGGTAPAWCGWESLSGTILEAPDCVSWGPNRIDCFARGTDAAMYHRWWHGVACAAWRASAG